MRFDCAVDGAPWCTPFRGALISGRYPHQTGVAANGIRLPPAQPTVATAFNAAGYHTAYVGKWHLDGTNDLDHYVPPERRGGFHYAAAHLAVIGEEDDRSMPGRRGATPNRAAPTCSSSRRARSRWVRTAPRRPASWTASTCRGAAW